MQRRRLGSTDREIAVIGLGGKGLTGARRGVEPADVQRAVAASIEAGVELIDLSCPGSAGDAERRVGHELRALRARDRVVVATAAAGTGTRPPVPGQVQRAVEDSLRALRLDAIPLVWLAGWDDAWLDDRVWPELRGALARLIAEGKVMAWGAVAADDRLPGRVVTEPWLAALQVRYSLFDRRAEEALLPAAAAAGVAVIAREPLAGGALGGELGPDTHFLPGDERVTWPRARWLALVPELARLAALVTTSPPAARATADGRALLDGLQRGPQLEQATVAELALRFAVAHPAIAAAIPGARTIDHARDALACADGRPLPAPVKAALDGRAWCPAWYGR